MAYTLLSKEFYKNPENYEKLYKSRFESESSVHLPLEIKGNPSFFIHNNEITYNLVQIYKCCDNVKNLFYGLPEVAKESFITNTLIEEITVTNEIEGVSSTRQEIEDAIDEDTNPRRKNLKTRFLGIVNKYNKIINGEIIKLESCEDIRILYDEFVFSEIEDEDHPDGDIFRKGPVNVITATQKVKHKGDYPESKIIENMQKSLDFMNDDEIKVDKILKIAIFHYYFGYIHPFYDGNGRLSRFISSYLLSKELELFAGLRLSYAIKNQIQKYYDSFDFCNDTKNKGDLTSFIYTFLNFIINAYKKLEKKITDSEQKLTFYYKVIKESELSESQKDILFILVQNSMFDEVNGLSIASLSNGTQFSMTKTRAVVKDVLNKGLLKVTKDGHKNTYNAILEEIEKLSSDN